MKKMLLAAALASALATRPRWRRNKAGEFLPSSANCPGAGRRVLDQFSATAP